MKKEREIIITMTEKDLFLSKEFTSIVKRINPYIFYELGIKNPQLHREEDPQELKEIGEFFLNENKRISIEDRLGENCIHLEKTSQGYLSVSVKIIDDSITLLYDLMSLDFANEYGYISGMITNRMSNDVNINIPTLRKLSEEGIHNLYELIGNQLYLWNIYTYGDYKNKVQPKIDKSVFINCPAYRVEELKNGCVLLQLAKDLSFEEFDEEYYNKYKAVYHYIKAHS